MRELIFNCWLITGFIIICLIFVWQLPDICLTCVQNLSDICLILSDIRLIFVWYLSDNYLIFVLYLSDMICYFLIRFLNNRELAHVSFALHRLLDEPRVQLVCCLLDLQVSNNNDDKGVNWRFIFRSWFCWDWYLITRTTMADVVKIYFAGQAHQKWASTGGRNYLFNYKHLKLKWNFWEGQFVSSIFH